MIQFSKTIEDNEFDNNNVTITIPTNSSTIYELCKSFELFLKACDYQIDGKSVSIIEQDDND